MLSYYLNVYRSIMMGYTYFRSPDYLVVQGLIRATLLYPTKIYLARSNAHHYTKLFHGDHVDVGFSFCFVSNYYNKTPCIALTKLF